MSIRAPVDRKRRQEKLSESRVTAHGIYGLIRHPMYASQWLLVIGQPLLLQNWIAGFGSLIVFVLFHLLRVNAEKEMMIDSFGHPYRDYTKRVGGVFPKLGK